jgi:tRNA-dihydrouridine synthase A
MQYNHAVTFAVAPMMDWTDRHCRYFHRQLSRRALLYTEMVVADAVLHGDRRRLLGFDASEHPVALQLGGNEPRKLAEAARIGAEWGYDEINLNVGCPSDRVRSGTFGACLMLQPELVAECVAAMKAAVRVPVTVKCRIGVDHQDPEEALPAMAEGVFAAGADALWVHARKAWLQGLSPRENREIPPLDYPRVHRLKRDFPGLTVVLNGGLTAEDVCMAELAHVDGVMLGRAAYQDPWLIARLDRKLFDARPPLPSLQEVLDAYFAYASAELEQGTSLRAMTRHLMGLVTGKAGARRWRRELSAPVAGAADLRRLERFAAEFVAEAHAA